jgi:hypothetical protein
VNFFIQRHIASGGAGSARLEVFGIGLADVFWNGLNIIRSNNPNAECTELVNASVSLVAGDNVLMVHGYSNGPPYIQGTLGGYLDVQLSADRATPVHAGSWGRLKSIYR